MRAQSRLSEDRSVAQSAQDYRARLCASDRRMVFLKRQMVLASGAKLTSRRSRGRRRRNLDNSEILTLLARASRLAFHATMRRTEGDFGGPLA